MRSLMIESVGRSIATSVPRIARPRRRLPIEFSVTIRADSRRVLYAITIPEYIETWLAPPSASGLRIITKTGDCSDLLLECYNAGRLSARFAVSVDHITETTATMSWHDVPTETASTSIAHFGLKRNQGSCLLNLKHKGLADESTELWYSQMWQQSLSNLCRLLNK